MVIAVDFDGTIVKDEWPEIGKLRFGARRCLWWLIKRNHTLILWTCRQSESLEEAIQYLKQHSIRYVFDYINENDEERIDQFNNDPRKIGADWYIDDKAGFLGWWSVPLIVLWLERREKRCKMKTVK